MEYPLVFLLDVALEYAKFQQKNINKNIKIYVKDLIKMFSRLAYFFSIFLFSSLMISNSAFALSEVEKVRLVEGAKVFFSQKDTKRGIEGFDNYVRGNMAEMVRDRSFCDAKYDLENAAYCRSGLDFLKHIHSKYKCKPQLVLANSACIIFDVETTKYLLIEKEIDPNDIMYNPMFGILYTDNQPLFLEDEDSKPYIEKKKKIIDLLFEHGYNPSSFKGSGHLPGPVEIINYAEKAHLFEEIIGHLKLRMGLIKPRRPVSSSKPPRAASSSKRPPLSSSRTVAHSEPGPSTRSSRAPNKPGTSSSSRRVATPPTEKMESTPPSENIYGLNQDDSRTVGTVSALGILKDLIKENRSLKVPGYVNTDENLYHFYDELLTQLRDKIQSPSERSLLGKSYGKLSFAAQFVVSVTNILVPGAEIAVEGSKVALDYIHKKRRETRYKDLAEAVHSMNSRGERNILQNRQDIGLIRLTQAITFRYQNQISDLFRDPIADATTSEARKLAMKISERVFTQMISGSFIDCRELNDIVYKVLFLLASEKKESGHFSSSTTFKTNIPKENSKNKFMIFNLDGLLTGPLMEVISKSPDPREQNNTILFKRRDHKSSEIELYGQMKGTREQALELGMIEL